MRVSIRNLEKSDTTERADAATPFLSHGLHKAFQVSTSAAKRRPDSCITRKLTK